LDGYASGSHLIICRPSANGFEERYDMGRSSLVHRKRYSRPGERRISIADSRGT